MVFVNSMSDLFHEEVPLSFISSVVATMRMARWHTYQVLTKRSERLREVLCGALLARGCQGGAHLVGRLSGRPQIWLTADRRLAGDPRGGSLSFRGAASST